MDIKKQKILIADDEEINLQILSNIFEDEYELILAKTGHEAIKEIEEREPDLILLDVKMPNMDGYEVIKLIKDNSKHKDIPVIFISALSGTADEEKGLNLGALDYISKPFSSAIVKARVKTHLKMATQKKLLEKIAMLDGLTEIPNRRSFNERFELEWRRAVRNRTPISLAILDIDFFKQYNDHYGHAMGDDALKAVSQVIVEKLKRSSDFAARLGGEEFAVLIPEIHDENAYNALEIIRQGIHGLKIEHNFSKISRCLTISIGGATIIPDRKDNSRELYEKADKMLYLAKNGGRNKTVWDSATNDKKAAFITKFKKFFNCLM